MLNKILVFDNKNLRAKPQALQFIRDDPTSMKETDANLHVVVADDGMSNANALHASSLDLEKYLVSGNAKGGVESEDDETAVGIKDPFIKHTGAQTGAAFAEEHSVDQEAITGAGVMGDKLSSVRRVESEHEEAAVGIKDPFIHRFGAQTGAAAFAEAEERSVAVDQGAIPGAVAMGDYLSSVRRSESEHEETTVSIKDPSDNQDANEKNILDQSPHDPRLSESYKKWKAFAKKKDDSARLLRIDNYHRHSHVGLHRQMLSSNLYYPSWTEKNECSNDGNEPM